MTEEIIIDGVNVAGCPNYYIKDGSCMSGDCECTLCIHNDCYYKEFKRLEQENKELKEYNKRMENQRENYYKEYNNYRSALEDILESAKFAQCLPCGSGNLEDCLNCNDDITNNGQFCMEKRIHEIKTKCVEVLKYSKE